MAPTCFKVLLHFWFVELPIFSVLWYAVAVFRFCYARHRKKKGSRLYDDAEMRQRKRQLIISSIPSGIVMLQVLVLIVILMLIEFRVIPFN